MTTLLAENYFHPGITLLGAAAFILFLAWEFAALYRFGKGILSILKGFSLASGIAGHILALTGPRFPREPESLLIGVVMICLAGYLLYRSLIAELPGGTYTPPAGKPGRRKTCRNGTYALIRHPALWWYGLFLAGLFIFSGAKWLLISGVVWWLANFLLVVFEDIYLYPVMFNDYLSYKRQTPMLIPNRNSLSKCLKTWSSKK